MEYLALPYLPLVNPKTRSEQIPYWTYVTALSQTGLFLDTLKHASQEKGSCVSFMSRLLLCL